MKNLKYIALILVLLIAPEMNAQMRTVVSLTGVVLDAISKQPIGVNVEIYDSGNKRVQKVTSNAKTGVYFATSLKPGETYEVRIAEFNYMRQSVVVSFPKTDKYAEFSRDLTLIPKKSGTKIELPFKAFGLHKSTLKFGSNVLLQDFINLFKGNLTVNFKIISFPDEIGDPNQNMQLTQARAESLRHFFIDNGIQANRISTMGNNTTDPNNPPPTGNASKGKRYTGTCYLVIEEF